MIEFISTTCSALDGLPVNESHTHRLLREFIGCAAAGLTYEDTLYNHPPPGVQHDTLRIYPGHHPYLDPQRNNAQLSGSNIGPGAQEPQAETIHQ